MENSLPARHIPDDELVKLKALLFHGVKYDTEITQPIEVRQWYDACIDCYKVNVTFTSSRRALDRASKKPRDMFHDSKPGYAYPPTKDIQYRNCFNCENCGGDLVVRNKDPKGRGFTECAYCGGIVQEISWHDNVKKTGEEK